MEDRRRGGAGVDARLAPAAASSSPPLPGPRSPANDVAHGEPGLALATGCLAPVAESSRSNMAPIVRAVDPPGDGELRHARCNATPDGRRTYARPWR